MRVGLISTAYGVPTPPNNFGGMERINYWLGQELIKQGHEVTLFGGENSYLDGAKEVVFLPGGGEIVPQNPNKPQEYPPFYDFMANYLHGRFGDFDIIHDSTHHHEFSRRGGFPHTVATIHNPNTPESHNSVFLSNFHRNYLRQPNSPYVMNGAPENEYKFSSQKGDYVLFMGALGHHKGWDQAVAFANKYEVKLKIAGHPMNQEDIDLLKRAQESPWCEYLGTIGGDFKLEVLSQARAVLMPFRWPEPGCILAIECMAAGTPMIGSGAGVLPEYIVDGLNGYLTDGHHDSLYQAYQKIESIDPHNCRQRFLDYFTIDRVAQQYVEVYTRAAMGERW